MKKVACLYRVSTMAQVEENDIPAQRTSCIDFINSKQDWVFYQEYLEKGVSGYKKSESERDVLQQIKQDAFDKKFDVLLVFMFDRLGRKEDETPFIVQWFDKQGVEIWSVKEGQQKFEGQADRLINYIRFWQSQSESEKTGIRVREKHIQMTKEGKWFGCNPPYGYDLILTDKVNKKGRLLHDLVISEHEKEVVKLIYELAINKGMGGGSIARELNIRCIPAKKGGQWTQATVSNILKNPVYKGYPAYSKNSYKGKKGRTDPSLWTVAEECNHQLIIVDEKDWDNVQKIRSARKAKLAHESSLITKNVPLNTNGKLLLVGMIHCGYCGSAMSTYSYAAKWNTKNGRMRKCEPAYKCNKKLGGGLCENKNYYRKNIIEDTVIKFVFDFLQRITQSDLAKEICLIKQNNLKNEIRERAKTESLIKSVESEIDLLKKEIVKVLQGTSKFSSDILSDMINEKYGKIESLKHRISELDEIIMAKDLEVEDLEYIKNRLPNWKGIYENGSTEQKRMMLCDLIDDIVVYRNKISVVIKPKIYKSIASSSEMQIKILEKYQDISI